MDFAAVIHNSVEICHQLPWNHQNSVWILQGIIFYGIQLIFAANLETGDWEKLDIIFFTAQGHITPMWLVRSGRNLNPSNILCLSLLHASLRKIRLKMTEKTQDTVLPIICQWELSVGVSVAMVTTVLIWPKIPNVAFPQPQRCYW